MAREAEALGSNLVGGGYTRVSGGASCVLRVQSQAEPSAVPPRASR